MGISAVHISCCSMISNLNTYSLLFLLPFLFSTTTKRCYLNLSCQKTMTCFNNVERRDASLCLPTTKYVCRKFIYIWKLQPFSRRARESVCYFPINCFNYGEFFFGRGRKRNVDLKKNTWEKDLRYNSPTGSSFVRSMAYWAWCLLKRMRRRKLVMSGAYMNLISSPLEP